MKTRFGFPQALAEVRGTVGVCSINCQRKFTLITSCVRTRIEERGSVCVVIRPVCLMVAPCAGPGTRRGRVSSPWGRVRGLPDRAEGRIWGGQETWDLVEDGSYISRADWLLASGACRPTGFTHRRSYGDGRKREASS